MYRCKRNCGHALIARTCPRSVMVSNMDHEDLGAWLVCMPLVKESQLQVDLCLQGAPAHAGCATAVHDGTHTCEQLITEYAVLHLESKPGCCDDALNHATVRCQAATATVDTSASGVLSYLLHEEVQPSTLHVEHAQQHHHPRKCFPAWRSSITARFDYRTGFE